MFIAPQLLSWYPSSVNRGYFSYPELLDVGIPCDISIHPLSIEAISPTVYMTTGLGGTFWYPSSVNRGYFSYSALFRSRSCPKPVSILCQSRLFLLPGIHRKEGDSVLRIHPLSIEAISPTSMLWLAVGFILLYPSSVNRGYFSYVSGGNWTGGCFWQIEKSTIGD